MDFNYSSDKLKGFITVKGPSIVKGDLKIKLSNYNRGHTMNKVVDSSKPILLQQVLAWFIRSRLLKIVYPWPYLSFQRLTLR